MVKKIANIVFVIASSFLIGRWVLAPFSDIVVKNKYFGYTLSGLIVFTIGYCIYRTILASKMEVYMQYIRPVILPNDAEDIMKLGVKNEIDFCFYMDTLFSTTYINSFHQEMLKFCVNQNKESWEKAMQLFQKAFGHRIPTYDPDSKYVFSWMTFAFEEAKRILNKQDGEAPTTEEVFSLLTPEFAERLQVVNIKH